jgi:KipI family sensor histidine kinase inhibitor
MAPAPPISPLGDTAYAITVGPDGERITALVEALMQARIPAVHDVVGGHTMVVLHVDPTHPSRSSVPERAASAVEQVAATAPHTPRLVEIDVCYDDEFAPDLLDVSGRCDLSVDAVIARHLAPLYTVELVGFLPGFAYLTGLDPSLMLPRRDTPRRQVPTGSVAIAAQYSGVYPCASPGGWHLIGRTSTPMLDLQNAARPSLLMRGDQVRFIRVARDRFGLAPRVTPREDRNHAPLTADIS